MAGFLVHIQLEVLVVVYETSSLLEYRPVRVVLLLQHIDVVAMRQLGFDFDHLVVNLGLAYRVRVTPVTLLSSFPQSGLHLGSSRLQIMVHHVEILIPLGKFALAVR
uniref:Uncharacterized protein n=1 Tax=Cacopsylla melanoneura TaxID=428564 RepID=A0A8D8PK58_9HEMI